jgi:hypothetical protein
MMSSREPVKGCRWFQFRLRTALLVTALVAAVLGFRVPQRVMARYHAQIQARYVAAWRQGWVNGVETPQGAADRDRYGRHRALAQKYRAAVQLPWGKVAGAD